MVAAVLVDMNMEDIFSQFGDIFGEDIFGNFFGGGAEEEEAASGQGEPGEAIFA